MNLIESIATNETATSTSKYPSNDVLDEDFTRVFEPFRKVQTLLGSCRVNIKNQCIAKPTIIQKCYTTICVIAMTITFIQLIQTYTAAYNDDRKMFYLWTFGISAVLVTSLASLVNVKFYDNIGNIDLYHKMQEIDRVMATNGIINSLLNKSNRRTAYSLVAFFVIIFMTFCIIAGDQFPIIEIIGAIYTIETFVVELSCCSSHITFFYTRVRLVNSLIEEQCLEIYNIVALSKFSSITSDYCVDNSPKIPKFLTIETDVYIKEIFLGYMIFKEQYRFQVTHTKIFLFCIFFVLWILFTFEYSILALQSNNSNKTLLISDFIFLMSLAVINWLILLVLCIGNEKFMREVRKTKHISILIMCRNGDGPLRGKARNILKLIEETPPSFSVYGMWCMDARLVLYIFHLITNCILNILQFTYL